LRGTCTNMTLSITLNSTSLSTLRGNLSVFTSNHSSVERYVHATFQMIITFSMNAGYTHACGQTSRSRTPYLIVLFSSMRDIASIVSPERPPLHGAAGCFPSCTKTRALSRCQTPIIYLLLYVRNTIGSRDSLKWHALQEQHRSWQRGCCVLLQ
jgi:hypothetical protein